MAGRYHIEGELGAGGMATVYLAQDLRHERAVAIKVLHPDLAASVSAERFLAEIKTTAKLRHPHVLPLYDSGAADGLLYYVMPRIEGESLRQRLAREGQLSVDEAIRIAREVADALAYAHAHDVIHRDIKPENILLEGEHALVADFGIARAVWSEGASRLTYDGIAIGTPTYMSPEQGAGERDIDGRSDMYSLACVLYEMLAGEPPFPGPTLDAVFSRRFTHPPPRVARIRPNVPASVDLAIERAMARAPADRFLSVSRFAHALTVATPGPRRPESTSIAVLPFTNLSPDPENDYLADGIAEEIMNALTRLPDLRVAARASAFSFRGRSQDLRRVGEQLNVNVVLEGSVRKSGNRLRITVQLTDTANGFQLWSERYDREFTDVFSIQDEIAGAIANRLKLTLDAGSDRPLLTHQTVSIEAYELFLRGRTLLYHRGPAMRQALVCFERAIELDATYAAAHAALAEALAECAAYGLSHPRELLARAKVAGERARSLDPGLAEASAALALVALLYDYDVQKAEQTWVHALDLAPEAHKARAAYSVWLLCLVHGDFDGASAQMRYAIERDPLSSYLAAINTLVLVSSERHGEAVAEAQRAVELDGDSFLARFAVLWAYLWAGDHNKVCVEADPALVMSGRHPWALVSLAVARCGAGEYDAAKAIYEELSARRRTEYVQPVFLALVAAAIGRVQEGLALLHQAVEDRDPLSASIKYLPGFETLRAHPEFRNVLERMGWT